MSIVVTECKDRVLDETESKRLNAGLKRPANGIKNLIQKLNSIKKEN